MFTKNIASVLLRYAKVMLAYRLGDAFALATISVLAAVGVFALTGSNRGLAAILALTCAMTARLFGWRPGMMSAAVATVSFDLLFHGAPVKLFLDTEPNFFLVYLGFFGCALFAAYDVSWLPSGAAPAGSSVRQCEANKPVRNGADKDALSDAVAGEAAAYKLLARARGRNATFLVTAEFQRMVRQGRWTAYEAGLTHGMARAALAAVEDIEEALPAAHHNADDVQCDAWVIPPDSQVLAGPVRDK